MKLIYEEYERHQGLFGLVTFVYRVQHSRKSQFEERVNNTFCVKDGKTFSQTYMSRVAYSNKVKSWAAVYKWFKCSKEGRQSLEDDT